jgi:SAM-dependent methyltransferase
LNEERRRGVVAPEVLDALREHPFYASYKARTIELIGVRAGGHYLDVGAGTGADARDVAAATASSWTTIDHAVAMARLSGGTAARSERLPFRDEAFDACRADRVLQYVAEPADTIAEMIRVVRHGGRIVVADPDYDTQVVEVEDQRLARRIREFRRDYARVNGAFAHRTPGVFKAAGLVDVVVEARTLVVRDPADVDNVMGLRDWAQFADTAGLISSADSARWREQLDEAARAGRFLYSVTFFVTAGTRA